MLHRGPLRWLISERFVMLAIIINTVALFMMGLRDRAPLSAKVWHWVDYGCVVFFVLEAILKIRAHTWRGYWGSAWNRFDLTVVLISLPVLLGPIVDLSGFAPVLVLRVGRLFRLFRLLRFIPNCDHLILGVRRALKASVGVFLALFLVNLMLALLATFLFRDLDPEHFGDPVSASYSMFQVFTVEGWNEIPERIAATSEVPAMRALVRLFFVFSVLVGGILGVSIANAVFVDEMTMDNTRELEAKVDVLLGEVRNLRAELSGPAGS